MRNVRGEEEDFNTIHEINSTSTTTTMASSNSTSSSSWSRFKDPRIVRVSRSFGGKDRHSKVCTVRGLRDRRVRLSVQTAIQVYDLQDRLGLNQPSKVVDWLLNVAKHEIDELPPLRFPDGRFGQNLHHDPAFLEFGGSDQSSKEGLKISSSAVNWDDPMKYSKSDVFWGKSKDVPGGKSDHRDGSWQRNQEERQFNFGNQGAFVVSAENNLISRQNPSSLPMYLDSTTYNNQVFRWDRSNLTLSQPSDQAREDLHNISLMPMAGSHQIMVYQSGTSTHESHFPSSNSEFDPKQMNFQASQSSVSPITSTVDDSHTAQQVRPSHFSVTANLLPSQNKAEHS